MDPETLGGASANQNCCHVSTGLAVVISCACSTRRAESATVKHPAGDESLRQQLRVDTERETVAAL